MISLWTILPTFEIRNKGHFKGLASWPRAPLRPLQGPSKNEVKVLKKNYKGNPWLPLVYNPKMKTKLKLGRVRPNFHRTFFAPLHLCWFDVSCTSFGCIFFSIQLTEGGPLECPSRGTLLLQSYRFFTINENQ